MIPSLDTPMQPTPSSGGAGSSPQASAAAAAVVVLLAAIQRGEDAGAIRTRLASLLPSPPQQQQQQQPPPPHGAGWEPWLSHLLHAALDRPDDPGVLTALLSHLVKKTGGSGRSSPAGSSAAAAAASGLPPLLLQLLTSALQRGDPGVVGVVLRHCGGDPDMPLPAFPRCVSSVFVKGEEKTGPRAPSHFCVVVGRCGTHQSRVN